MRSTPFRSARTRSSGEPTPRRAFARLAVPAGLTALVLGGYLAANALPAPVPVGDDGLVVLAYNDLGMHCMNEDFSELLILPPFNTLRAQVVRRGDNPDVISGADATVEFVVPSNTHSSDKTNFWRYAEALFGTPIPPDVGLTGTRMSGSMAPTAERIYEALGIPITPIDDSGRVDPYPLAVVTARLENGTTAVTTTVVPVSSEMTCNLCHAEKGISTALDVLRDHDRLHGTDLENSRPVLCAQCHADNALGAPGDPALPSLSHAIHGAHADRMGGLMLESLCYACHPGVRTRCQRDVHLARGIRCTECHGGMTAVADPAREPWVDQPRCGDCHERAGFEFEEPGKLFKDSRGHGGVHCAACHGSPHAITPTTTGVDNQQAIRWQGTPGVISDCLVCHTQMPDKPFPHRGDDD